MGSIGEYIDKWDRTLASIIEEESFGQIIEATEGYQKLVAKMRSATEDKNVSMPVPVLSPDERAVVMKLMKCFSARKQVLINQNSGYAITLDDIMNISRDFQKLFKGARFPVDTSQLSSMNSAGDGFSDDAEDAPYHEENKGTLLPCPTKLRQGDEIVKLSLNSIGLKDATSYLDPFFTISVRDADGNELEQSQDTAYPTVPRKDKTVQFDATIYLQTPLSRLPDDAAVFFEFRHWKPKKSKISVRCWSMLTLEEIRKHKETALTLEIYAKPTDYKRKKFMRHSVKELWLHVTLGFVKG